jgi:hypothetical protein
MAGHLAMRFRNGVASALGQGEASVVLVSAVVVVEELLVVDVDEVVVVDGRVDDVVDEGRVVDVEELVEVDDDVVDVVVFAGVSSSEARTAKMISTAATATINTAIAHSNGFRAGLSDGAAGSSVAAGVTGVTAGCGWVVGSVPAAASVSSGTGGIAWVGSSGPVPSGGVSVTWVASSVSVVLAGEASAVRRRGPGPPTRGRATARGRKSLEKPAPKLPTGPGMMQGCDFLLHILTEAT